MEPNTPQTYAHQLFSGFFGLFWAIAGLFLTLGLLSYVGHYDLGVGDGQLLFWFTALIIAAILLIVWFHPEQRAKRGEK